MEPNLDLLTAAVYAEPDEDEPRRALAEVLLGRGDARGELINLQLQPTRSALDLRRERKLVQTHEKEWLAPLRGALVRKSVRWERGFPVAGRLAFFKKRVERDALVGLPALATLRSLEVDGGNLVHDFDFLRELLFESPLRGLRELRGVYASLFADFLNSDPPWALRVLHFSGLGTEEQLAEVAEAAAHGAGLPNLTELQLTYCHKRPNAPADDRLYQYDPVGNYGWLWQTTFGRRLTTLRMNRGPEGIVPWLPVLMEHGGALDLERLVFSTAADFQLERTAEGWTRFTGVFPQDAPPYLRGSVEFAIAQSPYPLELVITGYPPD